MCSKVIMQRCFPYFNAFVILTLSICPVTNSCCTLMAFQKIASDFLIQKMNVYHWCPQILVELNEIFNPASLFFTISVIPREVLVIVSQAILASQATFLVKNKSLGEQSFLLCSMCPCLLFYSPTLLVRISENVCNYINFLLLQTESVF